MFISKINLGSNDDFSVKTNQDAGKAYIQDISEIIGYLEVDSFELDPSVKIARSVGNFMLNLGEALLKFLPKMEDNSSDGIKYFKALLLILKRFGFFSFGFVY